MDKNKNNLMIPKEKFVFVNAGEHLLDKKFDDKPISYFRDAFNRFCKNRASVVAAIIIICIVLFAFITPLLYTTVPDIETRYAQMGPRSKFLSENFGIADGTVSRDYDDVSFIKTIAIGIGAENYDGRGVTVEEGMESKYQPIKDIGTVTSSKAHPKAEPKRRYTGATVETYLNVGFIFTTVTQQEYAKIEAWQAETGIRVLYPLLNEDNTVKPDDANLWYKNKNYVPQYTNKKGKLKELTLEPGMVLEDNYMRDENGEVVYTIPWGGGNNETSQRRIRVLFYNYYQYKYGCEPEYILGTDIQGYDMALRIAGGIKLSLLVAVSICLINFILGALYGAVEGYYGGWLDMTLERVSDILYNVPFIVVATLFNEHLAKVVGPVVTLIFAYVLTGWIPTASRVRTQFYRFKNQEYVMAARTLGARDRRIIWKHIFPNTLGTLITSSALAIPGAVLMESNLSFLGIINLGSKDTTSLGTLLSESSSKWTNAPYLMIVPAIVISLLMISFNLFGNGLRDAFNPSLRGVEE